MNITFLFEKFGIYNLIIEYRSVKLGIWYLYIHCCLLGVSCWQFSCRFLFDCVPIRVLLVCVSLEKMDVDEKLETLTNMVQQLVLAVANNMRNQGERPQQHLQHNRNSEDKTLKIDLPSFDGHSPDPEVYLDWEANTERYFDFKETTPEQQFKLAKIKLTKLSAVWLDGVQKQRREERERINTWEKLRKHLRRKYVPRNYRQQLCIQWGTLRQEHRTVSEYIQEWEMLDLLSFDDDYT